VLAAAGLLTRSFWLPFIGEFLVVSDPLLPADAVVALSGGDRGRVTEAAAVVTAGYGQWLVGTNYTLNLPGIRDDYAALVRREAVWHGVPEERVVTAPEPVETTYDEARAVRRLASEQGWRSVILVTDPYHTRRARLIFEDVLRGTGIVVAAHPVEGHWYRPESWWQNASALRETWTEYVKLSVYLLGYR
jgi:uncharacterized SAM-binding protein YcdF (DUF218 family)